MPGVLGGLFAIAITGKALTQILAVLCTIISGFVFGRICGAIVGLIGTKENLYDDADDFNV